jgi:hypothetical protein
MGITRPRLHLPSPALIVACLALFAALGGSTYAATHTSATGTIHFTNATLKNGWTNFGGTDAHAGYARDSLGVVHLRGAIHNGAGTAFVLPKSSRPKHTLELPALTGTPGFLIIQPGGQVFPFGTGTKSSTELDGISFVAGE